MSLPRALRPRPTTISSPSPSPTSRFHHSIQRPRTRTDSQQTRFQSTKPPSNPNNQPSLDPPSLTRIQRLLPKRLRPYTSRFRAAPLSHVTAFLLLHELTAVVPLVGLTSLFYWLDVVPTDYVFGPWAGYAQEGIRKQLGYAKRKGWFGLGEGEENRAGEERFEDDVRMEAERERERERDDQDGKMWRWAFGRKRTEDGDDTGATGEVVKEKSKAAQAAAGVKNKVTWSNSERGYQLGIQFAAAYAITKVLLYPRVALSIWLTPPVARGIIWARKAIFRL